MTPSNTFEQLTAWQKAHQFVLSLCIFTKKCLKDELFSLVSQMRRAATSITAKITEGCIRIGSKEKLHNSNILQDSLEETRNYIILSKDLGYILSEDKYVLNTYAAKLSRMRNAYVRVFFII